MLIDLANSCICFYPESARVMFEERSLSCSSRSFWIAKRTCQCMFRYTILINVGTKLPPTRRKKIKKFTPSPPKFPNTSNKTITLVTQLYSSQLIVSVLALSLKAVFVSLNVYWGNRVKNEMEGILVRQCWYVYPRIMFTYLFGCMLSMIRNVSSMV